MKFVLSLVAVSLLLTGCASTQGSLKQIGQGLNEMISLGTYQDQRAKRLQNEMTELEIQEQPLRNERLRQDRPDSTHKLILETDLAPKQGT